MQQVVRILYTGTFYGGPNEQTPDSNPSIVSPLLAAGAAPPRSPRPRLARRGDRRRRGHFARGPEQRPRKTVDNALGVVASTSPPTRRAPASLTRSASPSLSAPSRSADGSGPGRGQDLSLRCRARAPAPTRPPCGRRGPIRAKCPHGLDDGLRRPGPPLRPDRPRVRRARRRRPADEACRALMQRAFRRVKDMLAGPLRLRTAGGGRGRRPRRVGAGAEGGGARRRLASVDVVVTEPMPRVDAASRGAPRRGAPRRALVERQLQHGVDESYELRLPRAPPPAAPPASHREAPPGGSAARSARGPCRALRALETLKALVACAEAPSLRRRPPPPCPGGWTLRGCR